MIIRTIRTIWDGVPRESTSTLTQLLSSEVLYGKGRGLELNAEPSDYQ